MTSRSPIIDGLAHVTTSGLWLDGKRDASCDTLLRQMDAAEARLAILTALPGHITNGEVSALCRRHPDRFRGFGCPAMDGSPALQSIKRIQSDGLIGVKLHSRLAGFALDDPRLDEIVAAAVQCRLPVMVCGVVEGRGWSQGRLPHEAIACWADRFPDHPFILAHAGSHRILDAWAMARPRENVFLDLSHSLTYFRGCSVEKDIAFVVSRLGQRVLFGSDFPESSPQTAMEALTRCMSDWPGWNQAGVCGENWARILKTAGLTAGA